MYPIIVIEYVYYVGILETTLVSFNAICSFPCPQFYLLGVYLVLDIRCYSRMF